jgi:UDPglucose 6-dehydrogenase
VRSSRRRPGFLHCVFTTLLLLLAPAAGSDAVALLTDWPQYTTLPFRKISATMNVPIIFDGRNCLNRDVMRESGFQYYPMGRPAVENALRLKHRV